MTNQDIAQRLQQYARELTHQHNNLYRIRAYRRAAVTMMSLTQPVDEIINAMGERGLAKLPGIGRSLAITIARYFETGIFSPEN